MYSIRYIVIFFILFSFYYQTQALRRIKRGSTATQNKTAQHALHKGSAALKPPQQPAAAKEANTEHNWAKQAVAAVENAIDKAFSSLGHHSAAGGKSAPPMHSQLQYTNTGAQPFATAADGQQQQHNKLNAESGSNALHKASLSYLLDNHGLGSEPYFSDMQHETGEGVGGGGGGGGGAEVLIIDNGLPSMMGAERAERAFNSAFHQFHKPSLRSIANDFKRLAELGKAVGSQSDFNGVTQHNGNGNSDNANANNEHGNVGGHGNSNVDMVTAGGKQQNDNNFSGDGKGNVALESTVAVVPAHKRDDNSNHSNSNDNNLHSNNNEPVSNANAATAVNLHNNKATFSGNNGLATAHDATQQMTEQEPQQQQQRSQQLQREQRDELLKKSFSTLLTAQGLPTLAHLPILNKRQEQAAANNNPQHQPKQSLEQNHQNHNSGQCATEQQKQQQPQLQFQAPAQTFQFGRINGKMLPVESMLKFANMLLYKMGADSPLHAQSAQVSINSNPTGSVISVGPAFEGTDDMDAMDYFYNTFEPKATLLRGPMPAPAPLAPTILGAAAAAPGSTALVARPFAMLPPYSMAESAQPFNFIENALDMLLSAEDDGTDDEVEIRCPIHHETKKKATNEGSCTAEGAKPTAETGTDQDAKNVIQMCSCRFLRKKKNNG